MKSQSNETSDRRVLVVEDDQRMRHMLERALRSMEFEPLVAASAEEGLHHLAHGRFGIVIADLNLPGMQGLEFCERLRNQSSDAQIIILTGFGDLDAARRAIRLNVADFLSKPCSLGEIEAALDRALRRRLEKSLVPSIAALEQDWSDDEDDGDDGAPKRLEDHERKCVLEALMRHDGNRAETASELGISVRTLYYRLKEYERQGHIVR